MHDWRRLEDSSPSSKITRLRSIISEAGNSRRIAIQIPEALRCRKLSESSRGCKIQDLGIGTSQSSNPEYSRSRKLPEVESCQKQEVPKTWDLLCYKCFQRLPETYALMVWENPKTDEGARYISILEAFMVRQFKCSVCVSFSKPVLQTQHIGSPEPIGCSLLHGIYFPVESTLGTAITNVSLKFIKFRMYRSETSLITNYSTEDDCWLRLKLPQCRGEHSLDMRARGCNQSGLSFFLGFHTEISLLGIPPHGIKPS
ncbi:hypothetical protein J6590_075871 [Homalodisca vitripennis]|nr:hypothetical protein J6590_075871 [Homalodisca vitripennis]